MVHGWVVGGVCERVVGVGGGRHETGKDRMGGEGRGLLQRSERGRRKRASAESVVGVRFGSEMHTETCTGMHELVLG